MNFSDMSELFVDQGGWGVKTFWVALAIATLCVATLFVRLKLYRFVIY